MKTILWREHVNGVFKKVSQTLALKVSQTLALFRRIKHFLPKWSKLMFYNAYYHAPSWLLCNCVGRLQWSESAGQTTKVVILDHRTSLHVPSVLSSTPCPVGYHIFGTIFVKLSVEFFVHIPSCPVHRPPGCLLLLAIHGGGWLLPSVSKAFYHILCFPLLHCLRHLFRPPSLVSVSRCTSFPPTF